MDIQDILPAPNHHIPSSSSIFRCSKSINISVVSSVLKFCSVHSILNFSICNKESLALSDGDSIWEQCCYNKVLFEKNEQLVQDAVNDVVWNEILGLRKALSISFKQIFVLMQFFPLPITGIYKKVNTDISDFRGSVVLLKPHSGKLRIEAVPPSVEANGFAMFEVTLEGCAISCTKPYSGKKVVLQKQKERIINIAELPDAKDLSLEPIWINTINLPLLSGSSLQEKSAPVLEFCQNLQGLWTGLYASHGMEVLQISINTGRADSSVSCDVCPFPLSFPRLEGLKVIGDANVPANELSFLVDLSKVFDPLEEFDLDSRSILQFSSPDHYDIHSADVWKRKAIVWAKGCGQINRIQGSWNPEWEEIDFLFCNDCLAVLWRDSYSRVRHIIELKPLDLEIEM
mmetsp:Transcript_32242/g.42516  ORF Transcript_32242/g.42516 Transcript_32242/m.42516 type:complete len:401 (-) Transcript_32242:804-2006(-)